jgi:hypothetical protein
MPGTEVPEAAMRHVIIHYHIFKNAGSTIDSILNRNFNSQCGSIEGRNPWDTVSPDAVLNYARANPAMKAVSSHQARLPVPAAADLVVHPLLVLRHPIDRVGSVYSFERRQPPDSPSLGVKIAQTHDLAGYVRWRLTEGNGCVIRNFQTVHLSGRENDMRTARATDHDLTVALDRLSQLAYFGVVELFEESMCKLNYYLAAHFDNMDLSHDVINQSPERKESLEERLQQIANALGPDLHQELQEKNELDLQLYDTANLLFEGLPL